MLCLIWVQGFDRIDHYNILYSNVFPNPINIVPYMYTFHCCKADMPSTADLVAENSLLYKKICALFSAWPMHIQTPFSCCSQCAGVEKGKREEKLLFWWKGEKKKFSLTNFWQAHRKWEDRYCLNCRDLVQSLVNTIQEVKEIQLFFKQYFNRTHCQRQQKYPAPLLTWHCNLFSSDPLGRYGYIRQWNPVSTENPRSCKMLMWQHLQAKINKY